MAEALSFDDLIPQQGASSGVKNLSFDDLIPSSNQPASNSPTQGESVSPSNLGVGNNQQNNDLVHQLSNWGNTSASVDYSGIPSSGEGLNLAQKMGYMADLAAKGLGAAAEDNIAKPAARGLSELLMRSGGYTPTETDTSQRTLGNISPDAQGVLSMFSPTSIANASNMIRSVPDQQPIGNQLMNAASKIPENAMVDSEDQSLNQLLASNGQPATKPQGSAFMQGIGARDAEDLSAASDANFAASGGLYKQMRQIGAVLNDESASGLKDTLNNAFTKDPDNVFIPQLNPKTSGIVQHLSDAVDQGNIGINQIDQYRRLLSRVGSSEDGYSAGVVKKALDNYVNDLGQEDLANGTPDAVKLLNQARASYAASSRFDDIAEVVQKANGDPNRLKAGLTKFMSNDDNTIGWPQEAKDALKNAADTGIGENLLKGLGKFGIDFSKSGTGNTVLPVLTSMGKAGGAALVPGGVPLVAAGTMARQAQKYLARGKAEQLLNTLQNGVGQ